MDDATQDLAIARASYTALGDLGTAPSDARPPRSRVVLALFKGGYPTESLRHALALASELDADLHVVRVLPESKAIGAAFSRRNSTNILRAVGRTLAAHRATRSWIRNSLGRNDAVRRFAILHGRFVEQVAAYAGEVGARLILVPVRAMSIGNVVTSLANASRVSVLLARPLSRKASDPTAPSERAQRSRGPKETRKSSLLSSGPKPSG